MAFTETVCSLKDWPHCKRCPTARDDFDGYRESQNNQQLHDSMVSCNCIASTHTNPIPSSLIIVIPQLPSATDISDLFVRPPHILACLFSGLPTKGSLPAGMLEDQATRPVSLPAVDDADWRSGRQSIRGISCHDRQLTDEYDDEHVDGYCPLPVNQSTMNQYTAWRQMLGAGPCSGQAGDCQIRSVWLPGRQQDQCDTDRTKTVSSTKALPFALRPTRPSD
jgi:hypothetical protein